MSIDHQKQKVNMYEELKARGLGNPPMRSGWILFSSPWRKDSNPSFGVKFNAKKDKWVYKDFSTGEWGDEQDFLKHDNGSILSKAEHRPPEKISNSKIGHTFTSITQAHESFVKDSCRRLKNSNSLPKSLTGRGIAKSEFTDFGIGESLKGQAVVPITDLSGNLKSIKLRNVDGGSRYSYKERGMPSLPWCSPLVDSDIVLIVEGEFNAMACFLALNKSCTCIGMAGCGNSIPNEILDYCDGKNVFILSDNDKAGEEARKRWANESNGIALYPLMSGDACEVGETSRVKLRDELMVRIYQNRSDARIVNSIQSLNSDGSIRSTIRQHSITSGVSKNSVCTARHLGLTQTTYLLMDYLTILCTKKSAFRLGRYLLGSRLTICASYLFVERESSASKMSEKTGLSVETCRSILKAGVDGGIVGRRGDIYFLLKGWIAKAMEIIKIRKPIFTRIKKIRIKIFAMELESFRDYVMDNPKAFWKFKNATFLLPSFLVIGVRHAS